jgi:hypothetical protein
MRTLARLGVVGLLLALSVAMVGGPAFALSAPTASAFASNIFTFGVAGGPLTLSAHVGNASSCVFGSKEAVAGLPATIGCAKGTVSVSVSLPSNPGAAAVQYEFTLKVIGSGGSVKARPVTVTVEAQSPGQNCLNFSPGADLSYCDLEGADFSGVNLAGANLTNADLTYTDLRGTDLDGANLSEPLCSCGIGSLADAISGGIIGTPSALPNGWALINGSPRPTFLAPTCRAST